MDPEIQKKLNAFFSVYKLQTYKKGEILMRANESPSGVLYLADGLMKQYAISPKGDELVVNIFKPPAFFPMSWAINNTHNEYYYEALITTTAYKAPKAAVLAFIKKEPDVLYDLMRRVYRGTDGMLARMQYLLAGNARVRLITELIMLAKRFGHDQHTPIILPISQKQLAAHIGITKETINREMKLLKEHELITVAHRRLTVNDMQQLHEALSREY